MTFSDSSIYFKGSSRKHKADLRFSKETLIVETNDGQFTFSLNDMTISTPMPNSPLILTFTSGERIECYQKDGLVNYLEKNNLISSFSPYFIETKKNLFLGVLVLFFAFSFVMMKFGIPKMSRGLSRFVPSTVAKKIDEVTMSQFDGILFSKSELKEEQKSALINKFKELGIDRYNILFRKGNDLKANAIALVHDTIVITDELIELLPSDEHVIAVLLHEIGHIKNKHVLTQLIQDSFFSFIAMFYFNDLNSGVEHILNIGAIFYSRSFSKGFETESDKYAVAQLHEKGLSIKCFTESIEKLNDFYTKDSIEKENKFLDYLSTHPSFKERTTEIEKNWPNATSCSAL